MSSLNLDRCVVRNTAARKGRSQSVTPETTAARHLHYGRIILDPSEHLSFDTGARETGLVCLKGQATVKTEGASYSLVPYDAIYVPRDAAIEIASGEAGVDLAELAAPVVARHPVQFVAFTDVQKDAGLHFQAGADASRRELNILIGKNVRGGADHGRRHVQRAGQLDVVAAARARRDARRSLSLRRHARAGVRHPARLH